MRRRFEGRVALVTGASRGIGLAVAQRLAAEGASLVLTAHVDDHDELQEAIARLRDSGAEVAGVARDLCRPGAPDDVVGLALETHGRIDVAIANAGVSAFHDWLQAPREALDPVLATNLTATHDLLKPVAAGMAERGSGAIGITASTSGWLGDEMMVEYNVAKAGVIGLTRSLAVTLARADVRVNAVAPGWVETEMSRAKLQGPYWDMVRERIPLHRAARPSEVADVFAWVCSDEASYVTGAVIPVDGGLSAGLRYPRVETSVA